MQDSVKVPLYVEMNTHTQPNIPLSVYLIVLLALCRKGPRKYAMHVTSVNMYNLYNNQL
jgi:hypothetical protein